MFRFSGLSGYLGFCGWGCQKRGVSTDERGGEGGCGFRFCSENIRVISIIGRFLEHHRIFRFENGGGEKVQYFIGSADWMTRNLMRRVEVVTPIKDEAIKKELQVGGLGWGWGWGWGRAGG